MNVFYRPEQTARNSGVFSPSALKPMLVVEDWLARHIVEPSDVVDFQPLSRDDLKLAHDPSFVDGVLDLILPNGFENRDPQVASALPYTCGSLLAAARHALAHREHVCSPTSGFHHAGYDFAEGYCTFNGLMVAVLKLQALGLVNTVGILDGDMHHGNGTEDILERLSVQGVRHHTQGKHFIERESVGPDAKHYFEWLEQALADCSGVDLLIYQAGADVHVRDPLGGLLTEREMALRDHQVFKAFHGRPLVWNLAGGYQRDVNGGIDPVLRLHRNTAIACKAQAGAAA